MPEIDFNSPRQFGIHDNLWLKIVWPLLSWPKKHVDVYYTPTFQLASLRIFKSDRNQFLRGEARTLSLEIALKFRSLKVSRANQLCHAGAENDKECMDLG